MSSNTERWPRVVLRSGDNFMTLLPAALSVVARALQNYVEYQSHRVDEAIVDGNMPHADARTRALCTAEDILDFLSDAGVPCLKGYRKTAADRPLPSARTAGETP